MPLLVRVLPRVLSGPFLGASSSASGLRRTASGQGPGRWEDLCQTVLGASDAAGAATCAPDLPLLPARGRGRNTLGPWSPVQAPAAALKGEVTFLRPHRVWLSLGEGGAGAPVPVPISPWGLCSPAVSASSTTESATTATRLGNSTSSCLLSSCTTLRPSSGPPAASSTSPGSSSKPPPRGPACGSEVRAWPGDRTGALRCRAEGCVGAPVSSSCNSLKKVYVYIYRYRYTDTYSLKFSPQGIFPWAL